MSFYLRLPLLLLLVLQLGSAWAFVRTMVTTELEAYLQEHSDQHHFVKLFSPSTVGLTILSDCAHCSHAKPEFERVADDFSRYKKDISFVEIDAAQDADFRATYHILGFPSFILFKKEHEGQIAAVPYTNLRIAYDMARFLEEQTGLKTTLKPRPNPLTSFDAATLAEATKAGKRILLEVFSNFDIISRFFDPFMQELARIYQPEPDLVVGQLDGDLATELCAKYRVDGYPTLILLNGEEEVARYPPHTPLFDMPKLLKFINEACSKHRLESGLLDEAAGTRAEYEADIRAFVEHQDMRHELLRRYRQKADPEAKIYANMMQLAIDFGIGYLPRERARLSILLKSTWPARALLDTAKIELNVLSVFAKFIVLPQ